jgi:hypothetical protein
LPFFPSTVQALQRPEHTNIATSAKNKKRGHDVPTVILSTIDVPTVKLSMINLVGMTRRVCGTMLWFSEQLSGREAEFDQHANVIRHEGVIA